MLVHETKTRTREFLNPEKLLKQVPLEPEMTVADFGCGNGYFSVPSGLLIGKKGQVFALDIMEEALSQTATLAKLAATPNISTQICDLEKIGSCPIPNTSCDLVIISSLLHQAENKDNVIREAYRVLKTAGRLLVVEWQKFSPLGPPSARRLSKDEAQNLLEKYGFRPVKELPAGSFHFALLYSK